MRTKAFGAIASRLPLEPIDIERRMPGPHDITIDIAYCGVCHSDLHTVRSEWGEPSFPCVPGHEIVGQVRAVGAEVTRFSVGDTVGVGCMVESCQHCQSCADGIEQYCENGFTGTYGGATSDAPGHTLGGFSRSIVVDDKFVLRISHPADQLAAVAPLLCAGITTYSPLRHWNVGPGKKVGVVGIGGLGHMGIKIAHAMGAHVVALTSSENKRQDALNLGADEVVNSRNSKEVAAHGNSFDFILNSVAASHDLDAFLTLLKRDGTMCMLGVPDAPHPSPGVSNLIFRRRSLAGSLIGGIAETQEMLDFCAAHHIVADIEMIAIDEVIVVDYAGKIVASLGKGTDQRISAMATDPMWTTEAAQKRVVPIHFRDERLAAIYAEAEWGRIVIILKEPSETVLNFLLSVDFAWDIIDHVLTDPFDAMVVVGTDERLAFLSPVHEKFFGLKEGEGLNKKVREVIPNSRLHHVVRTGVAEVGQILNMGGRQRIVSRHPVLHDGNIVGAIGRVMFKGPQQLEEMTLRIKELEQKVAQYELESKEERFGEKFLDAIIGQSMAIQSVRQQIRKIAPLDVPVLIQGESGTGKELVARALHMLSARRDARLVTVNAAALPANLVESELFGYEAGSFTGADRKGRAGKFELADKGTIFLDEIGDMPIEVQSKLLRVLQDRVVERVGGERAKRVDFRLCSATNHNLEQLVEENKFRLDLFYRISPVCITIPPLSERVEDIPLLLRHFLQEFAEKYGTPIPEIGTGVPDFLMSKRWPGNIRQLRHEVERAVVFAEGGVLSETDFAQEASSRSFAGAKDDLAGRTMANVHSGNGATLKDAIDRLERDLIGDAMVRFKGNKKKVAERLGVSRSYLYKKLGVDAEVEDAGLP